MNSAISAAMSGLVNGGGTPNAGSSQHQQQHQQRHRQFAAAAAVSKTNAVSAFGEGATGGGEGSAATPQLDIPGFHLLSSLPCHLATRVNKVTPSGRLQSAVLVILSDALLLCSNRGGLHRYVPLTRLRGVTVFPRGRVLFHVGTPPSSKAGAENDSRLSRRMHLADLERRGPGDGDDYSSRSGGGYASPLASSGAIIGDACEHLTSPGGGGGNPSSLLTMHHPGQSGGGGPSTSFNGHNLLLSIMKHEVVVKTVAQLVAGIRGMALAVVQEDRLPPVELLKLRPAESQKGRLPSALLRALQRARLRQATVAVDEASKAMLLSTGQRSREAAGNFPESFEAAARAGAGATGGGALVLGTIGTRLRPFTVHSSFLDLSAALDDPPTQPRPLNAPWSLPGGGQVPPSTVLPAAALYSRKGLASSTATHQAAESQDPMVILLAVGEATSANSSSSGTAPRTANGDAGGGSTRIPPAPAPAQGSSGGGSSAAATMMFTSTELSFPAYRTLWLYLCYAARDQPGAGEPPFLTLTCLLGREDLRHQMLASNVEGKPQIPSVLRPPGGGGADLSGSAERSDGPRRGASSSGNGMIRGGTMHHDDHLRRPTSAATDRPSNAATSPPPPIQFADAPNSIRVNHSFMATVMRAYSLEVPHLVSVRVTTRRMAAVPSTVADAASYHAPLTVQTSLKTFDAGCYW